MNIVEEILKIERIEIERKTKNHLKQYNSGEEKHLKQLQFHK